MPIVNVDIVGDERVSEVEFVGLVPNWPVDGEKGTKGSFGFKKWKQCGMCRRVFKEDEVVVFRGKVYGVPCGCNKDIAQLGSKG